MRRSPLTENTQPETEFARLLREPGAALTYLVTSDLLSACELQSARSFVSFCTDRGLNVTVDRLEALERLGVFYPLLRVRYPKIQVKIERLDSDHVQQHGMLRDGETWDGELREENSRLSWRTDWIGSWIDEGLVPDSLSSTTQQRQGLPTCSTGGEDRRG